LPRIFKPFKPHKMKKLVFTLEVLLLLSALPVFFGLALARKHHVTPGLQTGVTTPAIREEDAAVLVYPGSVKNS
jgi:hypothetical protein